MAQVTLTSWQTLEILKKKFKNKILCYTLNLD